MSFYNRLIHNDGKPITATEKGEIMLEDPRVFSARLRTEYMVPGRRNRAFTINQCIIAHYTPDSVYKGPYRSTRAERKWRKMVDKLESEQ